MYRGGADREQTEVYPAIVRPDGGSKQGTVNKFRLENLYINVMSDVEDTTQVGGLVYLGS